MLFGTRHGDHPNAERCPLPDWSRFRGGNGSQGASLSNGSTPWPFASTVQRNSRQTQAVTGRKPGATSLRALARISRASRVTRLVLRSSRNGQPNQRYDDQDHDSREDVKTRAPHFPDSFFIRLPPQRPHAAQRLPLLADFGNGARQQMREQRAAQTRPRARGCLARWLVLPLVADPGLSARGEKVRAAVNIALDEGAEPVPIVEVHHDAGRRNAGGEPRAAWVQ